MSHIDYSQFVTERIHEGLNFNRNHRFFLIYGQLTTDEFLTHSMYRTTLRETLWATLRANNIERVAFYNAVDKFFFLDEQSAKLAQQVGKDSGIRKESTVSARSRMQRGPLGARDVLTRATTMVAPALSQTSAQPIAAESSNNSGGPATSEPTQPSQSETTPFPRFISMTPTHGPGMADAAVLNTLNDLLQDREVRTAVVIEDLENLSSRFDDRLNDQLGTRLSDWNAMKAENRNVVIFITNREPEDEQSIAAMKTVSHSFSDIANLINIALGQKRAAAQGFIWYVPSPYEDEVARLLDEVRLKDHIALDWSEQSRVVRWLAAENLSFKDLDGFISEYARSSDNPKKISLELIRNKRWVTSDADPRPALDRLNQMIGMNEVKAEIRKHINYLQSEEKKHKLHPNLPWNGLNLHLVLTGNPGTGKTTVARLIGEIYRDIGLLRRGYTKECNRSHLVGEYEGHTAQKTNAAINESLDGVLFIDEAYALNRNGDDPFGKEAIDTLVARMENERHRLTVIVAGYPKDMQKFITSNTGLSRRFSTTIHVKDYSPEELLLIFEHAVHQRGHTISAELRETMQQVFARMYELREDPNYFHVDQDGNSGYGNAGEVRNVIEAMLKEQADRLSGDISLELTTEDIPQCCRRFLGKIQPGEDPAELNALMAELNALIGLEPVKRLVQKLVVEQQLALKLNREVRASAKTRHMLFVGDPGTGKTTVARLIGRIYKALGLLQKGEFFEAKHTDLVGQYVGETAQKTQRIIEGALDGVLFIDEAYSLTQSAHTSYGLEAINTLLLALENHRDRLVVIFAGYTREMEAFVRANPGVASRIGQTIVFPNYSGPELLEIFLVMASAQGYITPDDVREELGRQFDWLSTNLAEEFSNARGVRVRFFDRMIEEFDRRMFESLTAGEDVSNFSRSFLLSDVPKVAGI